MLRAPAGRASHRGPKPDPKVETSKTPITPFLNRGPKNLEFIAKQGHKCLTYIDLDNNNDYRMATNKITDWKIKWN